jgi:GeoRSP system PqqD family protein
VSRYFRDPDALWREEEPGRVEAEAALDSGEDAEDVGTSVILFRGRMISLNLLGTEIWKLCDGKSLDELVAALAAGFDVGEDELREDVSAFLASLRAQGLVDER